MSKGFVGLAIAFLVVVTFAPQAYAQNAATGDKPQTNTRRNPYIGTPVDGWTGQPVAQPPAATPAPIPAATPTAAK